MFKYVAFCVVSVLLPVISAASAAENCDIYTVVRGDTLRVIAERYYGARELSPIIYDVNYDIVGENPNNIEIGMELSIPCRDGIRMPLPTAFLAVIAPETTSAGAAPRFISKSGNTPFMNEAGTGIIPDLLAAALRKGGYREELNLESALNAARILSTASTTPSTMISFPWVKPDCGNPDFLSAQSQDLCQNYTFSDPIFEITLGLFTRADDPLVHATTPLDFTLKNLCITQLYSDDLLRQSGIINSFVALAHEPSLSRCIEGLLAGEFDAIVADYHSFATFHSVDTPEIVDIPNFAHPSTLHAIAYSQNSEALAVLDIANAGLHKILSSGEWFSIVNHNLADLSP